MDASTDSTTGHEPGGTLVVSGGVTSLPGHQGKVGSRSAQTSNGSQTVIIKAEPPTTTVPQSAPQPAVTGAPRLPAAVAAGPGGIRALTPQMLAPRLPQASPGQPSIHNIQLPPGHWLRYHFAQIQDQGRMAPQTATPTNTPPGQSSVGAAVEGMTPRTVSQTAGTTVTSVTVSKETMENVRKCKNFLFALIKMTSIGYKSTETTASVRELVKELLEGKLEAEEFTSRLYKELNSSPQTYIVPFLKKSLPAVRQLTPNIAAFIQRTQLPQPASSPASSTTPTPTTVVLGSPVPRLAAPVSRPQLQPGQTPSLVLQPQQQRPQVTLPTTPMVTPRNQAPGRIVLGQQQRKHPRTQDETSSQSVVIEDANEPESSSTQVASQPPLKQARIDTAGLGISQQSVNRLVVNFVVDDVQCFSLVEQPSFQKLIEGISGGKKVMCRKTLMQRIDREFAAMKESITSKLVNVDSVCTTADIWSAQDRSFFGMTCHWIDKDTLDRKSAALACARLKGRHTYDAVAAKLNEIHAEYKIQNKVTSTVTDNGSNFVKAFHKFGASEHELDDHNDGVTFLDISDLLREEGDEEQVFLPPHQRGSAHTLNLIATNEIHKAASSGPSRKLYRRSMAKCSSIWNKAHGSSLATEVIQEIANMHLIVPSVTRWSSEFRAIAKVVGLPEDELREICDKLKVARLHPQELAFLQEYSDVLQPLAVAINILQGENKCYLGFLIPTLLSLKTKLSEKLPHVVYTAHIIAATTMAIEKRFGSVLASHEAKMATTTMPKFRLCWLSPEKREDMRRTLLQEAVALEQQNPTEMKDDSPSVMCDESDESDEDFFVFENAKMSSSDSTTHKEVRKYLGDSDNNLKSLKAFPIVRRLFVKYNTTLPSSAPVERLFSHGGKLLTSSRNRMSDDHMEQVLLLRYNKQYCPNIQHDD